MKVAVTSRSFSKNQTLLAKLKKRFPQVKANSEGKTLKNEELIAFLKEADAAIIGLEMIDEAVLDQLPNLKIISKYGVGLNNLDLKALKKFGIKLGWTPGVNKRSVAELTLLFALNMIRRASVSNSTLMRENSWRQVIGRQLSGKTYGILGLGSIGQDLVSLLKPFGCRLIAYDIEDRSRFAKAHEIDLVDFKTLLSSSDVLSLHTPLDKLTHHLLSEMTLNLMKEDSVLINTARGGIVNEEDLYICLKQRPNMYAAFDVLEVEPPSNNKLMGLPNFYITPHIGGSSEEAIFTMGCSAIDGLTNFKTLNDYDF